MTTKWANMVTPNACAKASASAQRGAVPLYIGTTNIWSLQDHSKTNSHVFARGLTFCNSIVVP
jgi:hypothetical protein